MTEKEFTYIVNHYLYHNYGSLPASLRLFFGDGDGIFLCKHNKTENPRRKGQ